MAIEHQTLLQDLSDLAEGRGLGTLTVQGE